MASTGVFLFYGTSISSQLFEELLSQHPNYDPESGELPEDPLNIRDFSFVFPDESGHEFIYHQQQMIEFSGGYRVVISRCPSELTEMGILGIYICEICADEVIPVQAKLDKVFHFKIRLADPEWRASIDAQLTCLWETLFPQSEIPYFQEIAVKNVSTR